MAESMINRIALLYKKAKSSAWGRTFKSDSERNFYIAECLVKNNVVEVVRCEKCEHKVLMENGRVMCNRNARKSKTNNDWYGLTATANNHFCSYGKRKEVANSG